MTAESDPLVVIAEDAPAFSDDDAILFARERYGLDVRVRSLVSERDQNFHLQTPDGRQYVLKIANAAEDPEVTDFQIQALIHIAEYVELNGTPINAQRYLKRAMARRSRCFLRTRGSTSPVLSVMSMECRSGVACRRLN